MSPAGQVASYGMAVFAILMAIFWLFQLKKQRDRAIAMSVAFLSFAVVAYGVASSWSLPALAAPGAILLLALIGDVVIKARDQGESKA